MRKNFVVIFLVVLAMSVSGCVTRGTLYQGTELQKDCRSYEGTDHDYCMGFLRGVDNAVVAFFEQSGVDEFSNLYCIDRNITLAQQREAVVRWLDQNPGRVNDPAWNIVYEALTATFPCSR